MAARNEENHLKKCVGSLRDQVVPPSKITVVNDGSIDSTRTVAEGLGCNVIDLPYHKESYVAVPELNWKMATVYNHAFEDLDDYDFLHQMSPDIWLPPSYVSALVYRMLKNPKLEAPSLIFYWLYY
ncbi:glycosyltransferase family 2 protein [Candidatus Bathyarchaeota archaeon]|nr:glycosyltransferase family 2 protein [Candidatus Bathyarchaeota archaeon]